MKYLVTYEDGELELLENPSKKILDDCIKSVDLGLIDLVRIDEEKKVVHRYINGEWQFVEPTGE